MPITRQDTVARACVRIQALHLFLEESEVQTLEKLLETISERVQKAMEDDYVHIPYATPLSNFDPEEIAVTAKFYLLPNATSDHRMTSAQMAMILEYARKNYPLNTLMGAVTEDLRNKFLSGHQKDWNIVSGIHYKQQEEWIPTTWQEAYAALNAKLRYLDNRIRTTRIY